MLIEIAHTITNIKCLFAIQSDKNESKSNDTLIDNRIQYTRIMHDNSCKMLMQWHFWDNALDMFSVSSIFTTNSN